MIEILVVVAVIGVLAAIAIISLARARQSGNEASAIGSVRAITSGQAAYASSCGSGGYAQSNADLAKGPAGGAPFISPDLEKADVAAGFDVAIPGFGITLHAKPVWTCPAPAGWFCGAELSEVNPQALSVWRRLVDSVHDAA